MIEADKERQANRAHLQRAILDLRSRQASELARDLLSADRPKVSADSTSMRSAVSPPQDVKPRTPRRASSARSDRDRRPLRSECDDFKEQNAYLLRLQNAEDAENIRPRADVERPRPLSADCTPCRETFAAESDGPQVTMSERPLRPFTELVRLQRPGVTRQNRERVRAKVEQNRAAAAAAAAAKRTSCDAIVSSDRRLPFHG